MLTGFGLGSANRSIRQARTADTDSDIRGCEAADRLESREKKGYPMTRVMK